MSRKKKEAAITNEPIPILHIQYNQVRGYSNPGPYKSYHAIHKEIALATNRPYSIIRAASTTTVHTVKNGELKAMSMQRSAEYVDKTDVDQLIDFING